MENLLYFEINVFKRVDFMNRKKRAEALMRVVEIDKEIKVHEAEINMLQKERTRLDKARLDELYEEEQII